MKNKQFLFILIATILATFGTTYGILLGIQKTQKGIRAQTVAVREVSSDILATGTVHSVNEATLHFQTGGKLVYLPVKEGDTVYQGQTIAQLDTYPLQQQLSQALNTYRSTRDVFDQVQQNSQSNVLQNTQQAGLNLVGAGIGTGQTNYINDIVKRIVDENQANLDNTVINVQLANYAMQLATLTAPFNGVITHEDVTVVGQNVTSTTNFLLADPTQMIFKANVPATSIDFVAVGSSATIKINGLSMPATIAKIYPQKATLADGEEVYIVDIAADNLGQDAAKLGQTGSVLIQSIARGNSVTVPTWTIVGHNSIWVEENGKAVLKKITQGQSHEDMIEVSGLAPTDKVITNPTTIAREHYITL